MKKFIKIAICLISVVSLLTIQCFAMTNGSYLPKDIYTKKGVDNSVLSSVTFDWENNNRYLKGKLDGSQVGFRATFWNEIVLNNTTARETTRINANLVEAGNTSNSEESIVGYRYLQKSSPNNNDIIDSMQFYGANESNINTFLRRPTTFKIENLILDQTSNNDFIMVIYYKTPINQNYDYSIPFEVEYLQEIKETIGNNTNSSYKMVKKTIPLDVAVRTDNLYIRIPDIANVLESNETSGRVIVGDKIYIKELSFKVNPSSPSKDTELLNDISYMTVRSVQKYDNTYTKLTHNPSDIYGYIEDKLSVSYQTVDVGNGFVDWISNSIEGFYNFEIADGISLGGLITVIITIGVFIFILKIFAGG